MARVRSLKIFTHKHTHTHTQSNGLWHAIFSVEFINLIIVKFLHISKLRRARARTAVVSDRFVVEKTKSLSRKITTSTIYKCNCINNIIWKVGCLHVSFYRLVIYKYTYIYTYVCRCRCTLNWVANELHSIVLMQPEIGVVSKHYGFN